MFETMAGKLKGAALGSVALTILFVILYRSMHSGTWYSLAITFGTISYHLVMRLAVGHVYNICMKNRADYQKRWYRPKGFESKLYEVLRVKNWKEKMPTYGA